MEQYIEDIEMYFELKDAPESTREAYLRRIRAFINFVSAKGKAIEDSDEQDVREYILYLKEQGRSPGTINNYISAVRFFHTTILEREWDSIKIPRMKNPKKLPVIPEREDISDILNGTENLKHKAILFLLYGSGLRVSEVAKLRISDICSKSMRVRVENAKHDTNRYAVLSDKALIVLRNILKLTLPVNLFSQMTGCLGFVKVRHYGLLASLCEKAQLLAFSTAVELIFCAKLPIEP